jgi:hypothetical protein
LILTRGQEAFGRLGRHQSGPASGERRGQKEGAAELGEDAAGEAHCTPGG